LYSIFFGTKAAKRKLPILKERWFDIAREVLFFPLKILKRRRTTANFSLNKDGGVFNGTMYIPFALSYKNALRIKHQDEINF